MAIICERNRSRTCERIKCVSLFLFFLIACFRPLATHAADVSVSAAIDPQFITLGESATLSITFTGTTQHPAPTLPDVPNLQIRYLGPSTQISVVNGQMSSIVTHNYTVTATAPGDYLIPALKFDLGGQSATTAAPTQSFET
jgi:BatD DUF11 like domain